jgi:hypothetical protein
MTKLVRKERNIYYEYYEVELTEEQEKLYKEDKDKFMDDFYFSGIIDFDDSVSKNYIDTTDTMYYLNNEEEPQFPL